MALTGKQARSVVAHCSHGTGVPLIHLGSCSVFTCFSYHCRTRMLSFPRLISNWETDKGEGLGGC